MKIWPAGFLALLSMVSPAFAEMTPQTHNVSIPGGGSIELEVRLPDEFDPAQTYPMAFGGGYYWKNLETTHGWILVTLVLRTEDLENRYAAVFDFLDSRYKIEDGRAHMVCYSACGAAAFTVAGAVPDRFASVTTLSGHPRNRQEMLAVKDMKIQLIVGETDSYWRQGSEQAFKDFKAAGADVTLEIVPNGGHVLDGIAGAPFLERLQKLRPNGADRQ